MEPGKDFFSSWEWEGISNRRENMNNELTYSPRWKWKSFTAILENIMGTSIKLTYLYDIQFINFTFRN